ncbi:uncharacterized protein HHUB_3030 [Halobacterium hubeiense]|uniref:Uncharacterized protein n=1 Tax=Halobacterium hubeiense TaxID=1407499 RepID=A0A0U5CZS4_9EURY|nr:hypothetical protein [Halobacterium hubeiense]CQH59654.1 uncharacterized protein HHUB_3030 [Halobacterium hubeiense]
MSPELDARLGDLAAGEIALCTHSSGRRVVDALPESAFENLLLVTTDGNLGQLEKRIERRGGDPRRVGVIPVTGAEVDYDGPLWVTERVAPSDLTGVSIQFSKAFEHVEPETGWVVVDGVGVLSMYVAGERLFRLLDTLVGAVRARNARGVLVTAEGVLGEQATTQLRGLADEEVQLR